MPQSLQLLGIVIFCRHVYICIMYMVSFFLVLSCLNWYNPGGVCWILDVEGQKNESTLSRVYIICFTHQSFFNLFSLFLVLTLLQMPPFPPSPCLPPYSPCTPFLMAVTTLLYPKQSIDLMQLLIKYQWHISQIQNKYSKHLYGTQKTRTPQHSRERRTKLEESQYQISSCTERPL